MNAIIALPAVAAVLAGGVLAAVPAAATPGASCSPTCSFDVPDGVYEIQVTLGGPQAAQTGIDVESRRIALAPVHTAAGQYVTRSVTVEVRTPESMPIGEGPGTPGLQVRLTGTAPRLAAIKVVPRPHAPRLFVISDSTAADWLNPPKNGWAQALPACFRAGVAVANYAQSGASTVSYLADPKLFPHVQPMVRPGDEVLIQLAHNDKQTTEDVYRANLRKLVAGVRERGGLAVLVTPPVRHLFDAAGKLTPTGRVVNTLGVDLPAVIRDMAGQLHTPLLDLTAKSQALLENLGENASWPIYLTVAHDGVQDSSHLSRYGATVYAGLIAGEIRRAQLPAVEELQSCGDVPAAAQT